MHNLIEALQIFAKYENAERPTRCEYQMLVVPVNPAVVSVSDVARLEELGFVADEDGAPLFVSHLFGSDY